MDKEKEKQLENLELQIARLRNEALAFEKAAKQLEDEWIEKNSEIKPGDTISWDYGSTSRDGKIQKRRTGVVKRLVKGPCWSLRDMVFDYVIEPKSGYGRRIAIAYSWDKVRLEKKADRTEAR